MFHPVTIKGTPFLNLLGESVDLPGGPLKSAWSISNLEALSPSLFLPPISYCVEFGIAGWVAVALAKRGEWRRGEEEDGAYLGRINVSTDLP